MKKYLFALLFISINLISLSATAFESYGVGTLPIVGVPVSSTSYPNAVQSSSFAKGAPVTANDINNLRSRIDYIRASCKLPAYTWSDSPAVAYTTPIKLSHLSELRNSINALNIPVRTKKVLIPPPKTSVGPFGTTLGLGTSSSTIGGSTSSILGLSTSTTPKYKDVPLPRYDTDLNLSSSLKIKSAHFTELINVLNTATCPAKPSVSAASGTLKCGSGMGSEQYAEYAVDWLKGKITITDKGNGAVWVTGFTPPINAALAATICADPSAWTISTGRSFSSGGEGYTYGASGAWLSYIAKTQNPSCSNNFVAKYYVGAGCGGSWGGSISISTKFAIYKK